MGKTKLTAATAGAALVAALSGCAASDSGASTTETATYSAADIKAFTDYTGASAGQADDDATPINIGAVNADTGAGAQPELTRFLTKSVDLINDQLDGIDGRPLNLITCDVTSPETGLSCAQKFANDKSIVAIVQGSINAGSDSFHSVVDASGIPIVSALPVSPGDGTAPNAYYTASGSFSAPGAFIALLTQTFKAKTVALVIPDGDPVSAGIAARLGQQLATVGITVKTATFSPSETDPTAALLSAGVADADAILPAVVTPPACLSTAKVLANLGATAPVIALSSCSSTVVSDALGDLPKWTYLFNYVNPNAPSEDPTTQAQIAAYDAWWAPQKESQLGVIGLQSALTLQRHILAGGGATATAESIAEAARAWTGPVFLGPQPVAYGKPPFPSLPTLAGTQAYTYDGDDTWVPELGGQWLGAAPSN
jgi:branched-chain amino acid transport system substrate-binding protein